MTGGMAYEALNNIGHSRQRVHHRPQRQRPQLRADDLQPHRRTDAARSVDGRPSQPAIAHHRPPVAQPHQHPPQPGLREASTQAGAVPARAAVRRPAGREERRRVQGGRARVPAAAVVLRGARRALRRPDRRPRHRGAGAHVPQRDRAVGRGPDPRARRHAEGPGLSARRGRRREAPPRRTGVRPGDRSAAGDPVRLHAGVRRSDHQRGRGRLTGRRDHRGDGRARPGCSRFRPAFPSASSTSASPSSTPSPALPAWRWAVCDRSLRSTARSSIGRGTRSSTTSPCTACPVVFCLDRAGITGDNGPSHHGVYDLALLAQGARHARAGAVERAGAAGDAARRARDWPTGPGGDPLPNGKAPQVGEHEVGVGLHARAAAPRRRFGVHPRHRQARRRSPSRPPRRSPSRASTQRCGMCDRAHRSTRR